MEKTLRMDLTFNSNVYIRKVSVVVRQCVVVTTSVPDKVFSCTIFLMLLNLSDDLSHNTNRRWLKFVTTKGEMKEDLSGPRRTRKSEERHTSPFSFQKSRLDSSLSLRWCKIDILTSVQLVKLREEVDILLWL